MSANARFEEAAVPFNWATADQSRLGKIASAVRSADRADDDDFRFLASAVREPSSDRPLLIIVHPGDALQSPVAWQGEDEYELNVLPYSMKSQAAMAAEAIERMQDGVDVVVVHRGSCSQFTHPSLLGVSPAGASQRRRWIDEGFDSMVQLARTVGAVLYGDDLEAVHDWLMQHAAIVDRPMITLTGAYSDIENGCVTAVGQALEKVVGSSRVEVSPYAMVGNTQDAAIAWSPGAMLDADTDIARLPLMMPPARQQLVFNVPSVAMPPASGRDNERHIDLRQRWSDAFPDTLTDPEVDREEWFEQADRWDALCRSGQSFETVIGSMPPPDPALIVVGVYTQNHRDGGDAAYTGYAWPDAVSAAAARNWYDQSVIAQHVGRRFVVGDVPGEAIRVDAPSAITLRVSALAQENGVEVVVKVVSQSKYMPVETMHVPAGVSPRGVQALLWETLGFTMEHLADTKNGLQVSERLTLHNEYRVAMIDYRPVAGAGCIERFDPRCALDPSQPFDPQVERRRNDQVTVVDSRAVEFYRSTATAIGQELRAQRSPLQNFVLDLAQTPDGSVVVIECNPMLNFGQYAMSFSPVLDAVIQTRGLNHALHASDDVANEKSNVAFLSPVVPNEEAELMYTEDQSDAQAILIGRERGSDAFIAVFPPAYIADKGVLTARYEWDESNPQNASLSGHAYYKGSLDVDGIEVFAFDDIGAPLNGQAVDSDKKYSAMLAAVVSFGSAFEGSGHGEVTNTNTSAYLYDTVFQMASLALEEPRFVSADLPIVRPQPTDIVRDRTQIEHPVTATIEIMGMLADGKIIGRSGAALEAVEGKAFEQRPREGDVFTVARATDGSDRALPARQHTLER